MSSSLRRVSSSTVKVYLSIFGSEATVCSAMVREDTSFRLDRCRQIFAIRSNTIRQAMQVRSRECQRGAETLAGTHTSAATCMHMLPCGGARWHVHGSYSGAVVVVVVPCTRACTYTFKFSRCTYTCIRIRMGGVGCLCERRSSGDPPSASSGSAALGGGGTALANDVRTHACTFMIICMRAVEASGYHGRGARVYSSACPWRHGN